MSTEPFLSEIVIFSFDFAPKGWARCSGQLLPISQNQALFALLGTTFGGDGRTTFALPDLRGRAPLGQGQGPQLSSYQLGQTSGAETSTLSASHLPAHTHAVTPSSLTATARGTSAPGNQQTPVGALPAVDASGALGRYSDSGPNASMQASAVGVSGTLGASTTGSGQAHENRQPYLAMTVCIALQGIFPSQA